MTSNTERILSELHGAHLTPPDEPELRCPECRGETDYWGQCIKVGCRAWAIEG